MPKRRKISQTELHEVLMREFASTAAGLCAACRVPRPIFREAKGRGPNWAVPSLEECNALCHTILVDIAKKLGSEYDMAQPRGPA